MEIAGVNLNPHEQDNSKKPIYFRSINGMNFPNFAFALRVINERQNQGYNRLSLDTVLATVGEDPTYRISLALKRLCGGAVGVFAPTPSCACLTAWGGWTLYLFRQCWRSRFSMEADGNQSVVGRFCSVSSAVTRLMRFIAGFGWWLHEEIVKPDRLPWC